MSTRRGPVWSVAALAVTVAAATLAVTFANLRHLAAVKTMPGVGLLTLAIAFGLAEALPVHFEHRREAISITMTTVPLVVGLVAVAPVVLIASRVMGSGIALVVQRRQRPLKLGVNLASFCLEAVISVVVFRALVGPSVGPAMWPVLLVAVFAGDTSQSLMLTTAISLFQRKWEASLLSSALVSAISMSAQVSLGCVTLTLLRTEPIAVAPLGVVVALVLVSTNMYRSLSAEHQELTQIHDFTSAMSDAVLEGQVVPTLLDQARDLMHADRAQVFLDAPAAALVADGPRLITPNDPEARLLLETVGSSEALVAPLSGSSGVFGAIAVTDRSGEVRSFGQKDLRLFTTLANHASVSLENDRLVYRLREKAIESEHQSLHDALTGLPNRVLFARRVERALRERGTVAVLLLDLDRFKEVNDTLGHLNGDRLLEQVGDRLRSVVRPEDLVARLGGDEFAVLMSGLSNEAPALRAGEAIVKQLERPFAIDDLCVDVGASVGVAIAPRDGSDAVSLLQRADVAMYTAKADQSRVQTYDADRDAYSPERLSLVGELRTAIEVGQLVVHYQPQVNLSNGTMIGAEALVRWRHPSGRLIFPNEFISVAEHAGLVRPLTFFVLEEALAAASRWDAQPVQPRVAVNLSPRSLLQPHLVDDIADLLRRYEVDRGILCLEVTESSIMTDHRRAAAVLESLNALGVVVSVDDFGTGHSSLSHLKHLPVDEIKIDKSFVTTMREDRRDDAIVRTILELGRNLDISVVAEGIEDNLTRSHLRSLGCPIGQGWLFGKAMPAAELEDWIRAFASPAA